MFLIELFLCVIMQKFSSSGTFLDRWGHQGRDIIISVKADEASGGAKTQGRDGKLGFLYMYVIAHAIF